MEGFECLWLEPRLESEEFHISATRLSYCLTCHGELKVEFVNVARETFVKKELRTNKLDTLKQRKNFQKGVVLKIEIFIPSDLL